MKAITLVTLLLLAVAVRAQRPDIVGIELGGTADMHKRPSLLARLSYSTPIGDVRIEGGGVILFGRDGGFGFDVLCAYPTGMFEPFAGARFLVWEQSMSAGFPLGIRLNAPAGSVELTLGISVAPTLHLTAEESDTFLFDTFIGVRF